jgi:hypothetical protein
MSLTALFLLLLSWPLLVAVSSAHPNAAGPPRPLAARDSDSRSVPPLGFYDPRDHGGSWLTVRTSPHAVPSSFREREREEATPVDLKKKKNLLSETLTL